MRRLFCNVFITRNLISCNALVFKYTNINELKQYSIDHCFFDKIMGAKGWFNIYFSL